MTGSVATHTFTSGTYSITQTFSLPTLVGPFHPSPACATSIMWSSSVAPTPGSATFQAWDYINPTTAVVLVQDCWPLSLPNFYARGVGFDDISSLAFPGTACIVDWTTACTTTFAWSSSSYTQTWCCPSSYECLTGDGKSTEGHFGGKRFCVSHLSTATQIWTFDSAQEKIQQYTISDAPTGKAFPVVHWALPLAGSDATSAFTSGDTATKTGETTASASSSMAQSAPSSSSSTSANADSASQGLSSGAIAGIAVACTAAVFVAIGVAVFFLVRGRLGRTRTGDSGLVPGPESGRSEVSELKAELDASQGEWKRSLPTVQPPEVRIPELYANTERAELDGTGATG